MENKRKSKLMDSVALNQGKIPPQAVDIEEVVLGALLIEPSALQKIVEYIHPKCFYVDAHQKIYEAILSLFNKSKPVDIVTVTQELRAVGTLEVVGGAYFISKLTNRVTSAANIEFHSRIILEKYMQRELIRISSETIRDSYEEETDLFDIIDNHEKQITAITNKVTANTYEESHKLYAKSIIRLKAINENNNGISGVPSGFIDIDRITGGWQNSDLIILAARPGMGKTSLALQFLKNPAIRKGLPVAMFSLEMGNAQLYARLQSQESEIPLEKLLRKGITSYELDGMMMSCNNLINAPLFIDDSGALTIFELKNKARKLKREKDIQLIVVDYLQLMRSGEKNHNKEGEISQISGALKALAKELNIPIIALSQLSRETEKRGGNKPQLSDLRDSGAIEQDADIVMFIYRPEYYGIMQDDSGNSTQGKAMVIVAKHRNGELGSPVLNFNGQFTKFYDNDFYEQPNF